MHRTAFLRLVTVGVAAAVTLPAPAARADEAALVASARSVAAKHADAVVSVSAVLKMNASMMGMGGEREQKTETPGTIIDKSGLTVVSLSRLDPLSLYGSMTFRNDGEDEHMDMKTDFSDVKIRLADATEVPARIVLKDTELDLGFVMPDADSAEAKKVGGVFPHIDLPANGVKGGLLDGVISLARLGSVLDRQPMVSIGRINAVISKPRTYYVVTTAGMTEMGTPVFAESGAFLGVTTLRKREGGMRDMMRSMSDAPFFPVVLPVDEVRQAAEQAMTEAKKPASAP